MTLLRHAGSCAQCGRQEALALDTGHHSLVAFPLVACCVCVPLCPQWATRTPSESVSLVKSCMLRLELIMLLSCCHAR